MEYDELKKIIERQLESHEAPANAQTACGSVMYSGISTIKKDRFYLMGFNPAEENTPIAESICAEKGRDEKRNYSAYTMDNWKDSPTRHQLGINDRLDLRDRALHQTQVVELCGLLYGVKRDQADTVTEQTFSANAIFAGKDRIKNIPELKKWWNLCWPVHQYFLSRIKPKYIITLGYGKAWNTSAFSLLLAKARLNNVDGFKNIYSDNLICGRHFHIKLSLLGPLTDNLKGSDQEFLDVTVLGIKHPSYPARVERLGTWISENIVPKS